MSEGWRRGQVIYQNQVKGQILHWKSRSQCRQIWITAPPLRRLNIQKKQQRMAEEEIPEERVRAVEVLEGSRVMCGFCSKLRMPVSMEGGKMFFLQMVTVHYFCLLLFAYNSLQRGEDT